MLLFNTANYIKSNIHSIKPIVGKIDNVYKLACKHLKVKPQEQWIDERLFLKPNMFLSNKYDSNPVLEYTINQSERDFEKMVWLVERKNFAAIREKFRDVKAVFLRNEMLTVSTGNFHSSDIIIDEEIAIYKDKMVYEFIVNSDYLDLGKLGTQPFLIWDYRTGVYRSAKPTA